MLDLSIRELKKALTTQEKKTEFLRKRITITEKFDGTKLTLIRNNEPFDPNDYTKNWVVAYKENVLFPGEYAGIENDRFYGLDSEGDVGKHSIGTSQYGFVHDHLRNVHKRCAVIPRNVEFFVEFIQRKHTLTRDYENFHDMFLIGYASASYIQREQRIFSVQQPLETHILHHYAPLLDMKAPPILWDGPASELGTVDDIISRYENMLSTLGGKAEGVIIRTNTGELYKIVAKDQYDKDVRKAKKNRWALEAEDEKKYWQDVYKQAADLVKNVMIDNPNGSINEIMVELSRCSYLTSRNYLDGKNDKKETIVLQDDLFLTAKLHYERTCKLPKNASSVGIFVMSGKPVHRGHWAMIEMAAAENDVAYVFVSTLSRKDDCIVAGDDMVKIWNEYLISHLPKNVVLRFSESPFLDSFREVHALSSESIPNRLSFDFYADSDDVRGRYNEEKLRAEFPHLLDKQRVGAVSVDRNDTDLISGTKMRWLLQMGDEGHMLTFFMHLPGCLSKKEREEIWTLLRRNR